MVAADAGRVATPPAASAKTAAPSSDSPTRSRSRGPRQAPPGWHAELEEMLTSEAQQSAKALAAGSRRLSFRGKTTRNGSKNDGSLRGYIRQCFDGCAEPAQLDVMKEELRRLIEMFAAAGKMATTEWKTLPPPV